MEVLKCNFFYCSLSAIIRDVRIYLFDTCVDVQARNGSIFSFLKYWFYEINCNSFLQNEYSPDARRRSPHHLDTLKGQPENAECILKYNFWSCVYEMSLLVKPSNLGNSTMYYFQVVNKQIVKNIACRLRILQ